MDAQRLYVGLYALFEFWCWDIFFSCVVMKWYQITFGRHSDSGVTINTVCFGNTWKWCVCLSVSVVNWKSEQDFKVSLRPCSKKPLPTISRNRKNCFVLFFALFNFIFFFFKIHLFIQKHYSYFIVIPCQEMEKILNTLLYEQAGFCSMVHASYAKPGALCCSRSSHLLLLHE